MAMTSTIPRAHPAKLGTRVSRKALRGDQLSTPFTTTSTPNADALFGPAGERPWPADTSPVAFAVTAGKCGIRVSARPRAVRIISPPIVAAHT